MEEEILILLCVCQEKKLTSTLLYKVPVITFEPSKASNQREARS